MKRSALSHFLTREFEPFDRLAVVLIRRSSSKVVQRFADVSAIARDSYQGWLWHMNHNQGADVYLSLNTIRADADGRTKKDIAVIRHVFLDFDDHAAERVRDLLSRQDLPKPSALINSSRDHWQAIWRVSGFEPAQAESLQRGLARQTGADCAATDSARVFRVPGFLNHKYSPPWNVSVQYFHCGHYYSPASFPELAFLVEPQPALLHDRPSPARSKPAVGLSQSERDWAFAKRQLALRKPVEEVIAEIATYRTDKHDPTYYARLTVNKAAQALEKQSRLKGVGAGIQQ